MNIVLLRVGIDSGCGKTQGPLFKNGSFEFIPIPEEFIPKNQENRKGLKTYGNTKGRCGKPFIDFLPRRLKEKVFHNDPEFTAFTYGDPTSLKGRLRKLERGDLLVFYAGLKGWDFDSEPALYIIGYFEVSQVIKVADLNHDEIKTSFGQNAHVLNQARFERDKKTLILVKGSKNSRLLKKAIKISSMAKDTSGRPLKVLSSEMQKIFGNFDGRVSIQRSAPRWVHDNYRDQAARFIRSLK